MIKFAIAIGYRIDINGSKIPLHYGEIKVTGDKYHEYERVEGRVLAKQVA
ncbi:MAG: DUF6972 family protein [Dolichospermum sp.]